MGLNTLNVPASSSHRLPTITATQALQDVSARRKAIPTRLPKLDVQLSHQARSGTSTAPFPSSSKGGIPVGQVTEVYGPPGVGKTAFALQVACNALHDGDGVVWIDTAAALPGPRLTEVLSNCSPRVQAHHDSPSSPAPSGGRSLSTCLSRLTHIQIPSLAHLLVLFLHPTSNFPPSDTSLIVVDTVSAPFATAFPRPPPPVPINVSAGARSSTVDAARRSKALFLSGRRAAVAGGLANAMGRVAAVRGVAVLALAQVVTGKAGAKLGLKSAMAMDAWEGTVMNRVGLWRDFANPETGRDEKREIRLAQVVKAGGKMRMTRDGTGADKRVPFVIETTGLHEITDLPTVTVTITTSTSPSPKLSQIHSRTQISAHDPKLPLKRKASEIADSEDEFEDEYGDADALALALAIEEDEGDGALEVGSDDET